MPSRATKAATIRAILGALRAIDADMERVDEAAAQRLGVNLTDFRCLDILSRGAEISAGELAVEAGLTTGAVTALVDRLERAGYVERKRDPNDRRRVVIAPTRKASALVWPLFEGVVATSTAVLAQFSVSELATILRFLELNGRAIRTHLERES